MIVLDFLLANTDRHWRNFGAIRDAVTLEWVGMAPIYDSGTSMWNESYGSQIDPFADIKAQPFAPTHNAQLELVKGDTDWIDFSALKDIQEEAYTIYEQANFAEPHRAEILSNALAQRCEHLQQLIQPKNSISIPSTQSKEPEDWEKTLPSYLYHDIQALLEIEKQNPIPLSWDLYYNELQGSIDSAYWGNEISKSQSDFLRKKYL